MNNIDYVARAKILMKRAACTAALVIVPLAAVSSNIAQAGAILPTSGFSCTPSLDGAPGSCPSGAGADQLPVGGNDIQGVKLFTNGPVSYFASGGISVLTLLTSGIMSGGSIAAGTVIPLSYDFSLAVNSGVTLFAALDQVTSWTLDYTLIDDSLVLPESAQVVDPRTFGSATFTGSGSGTFTSSDSLTTTQTALDGDSIRVVLALTVNWTGAASTLDITVPVNSLDVNAAAVPEPASLGLLGSGLALFAWQLARSRKRRLSLGCTS
jgi:hypothetical protein